MLSATLRSPERAVRRSARVWITREATHAAVAVPQPSSGHPVAMKTGSAIPSTTRSRLRRIAMAGRLSDVLKACVDKPESQEEACEAPHERDRHGHADHSAEPIPRCRTEHERDDDHQTRGCSVAGTVHGDLVP